MILIDTNALLVLILGLIDPKSISKNKRASIYEEQDFNNLLYIIEDFSRLVILPNIWTELDNLLNNLTGDNKYKYCQILKTLSREITEEYIATNIGINSDLFYELGLTDSLIIYYGKNCDFIITADSSLADLASANQIIVYDLVAERNKRLRQ